MVDATGRKVIDVEYEGGIRIEHAEDNRSRVMAYMHYAGEDHWRLTVPQWQQLYLLADGFGTIDREWAQSQAWDWSHVRDSTSAAFAVIWGVITRWHNAGHLKTSMSVEYGQAD